MSQNGHSGDHNTKTELEKQYEALSETSLLAVFLDIVGFVKEIIISLHAAKNAEQC